ncbi:DUF1275 domain-containing protein [Bdellovibrio sp. qaytius]|nr:DUF1275 domain-containing protein [Bdellovibrio sp. qaytius]
MFQHKINDTASFKTYFDWFILSFLAGSINTGGYLSCHRFVSHITGFATLAGISFERLNLLEAFGTLTIPLFFVAGVMASAYFEKKYAHKLHGQKYSPVMGLVSILLGTVALGGSLNWFGQFGDSAQIKNDFILLACLCGACGLLNGAITSASGFTIRTTHLTGLATDLGLGLVRVNLDSLTNEQKSLENRANLLRIGTIFSFILGSFVGAFIFMRLQYKGFIFPMALSIYFSYVAYRAQAQ